MHNQAAPSRTLALFAIPFAANLVTAFFWFAAAHVLAADDLAKARSLQAYATVLIPIASLGLPIGVLVLASSHEHRDAVATNLRRLVLTIFGASSLTILAIVAATSVWSPFGDVPIGLASAFFLFLPFSISIDLFALFYQAHNNARRLLTCALLPRIVHLVAAGILLWWAGFVGFLISFPIAYAAMFFINLKYVERPPKDRDRASIRPLLALSSQFIPQTVTYNLATNLDLLLLNMLITSAADRGSYAFAQIVFSIMSTARNVVQTRITVLFSAEEHFARSKRTYLEWALLAGGLALVAYIGIATLAQIVIEQVQPGKYVGASLIGFFAIRVLIEWITTVVAVYAHVRAKLVGQSVGILVATGSGAALALLLTPSYGIQGLAFAQIVAAAVFLIFALAVFRAAPAEHRPPAPSPRTESSQDAKHS